MLTLTIAEGEMVRISHKGEDLYIAIDHQARLGFRNHRVAFIGSKSFNVTREKVYKKREEASND